MDRQHYRWSFFIIVFILASVYLFIFSDSGLLERVVLEREKTKIAANIEALRLENKSLKRLLDKYSMEKYPEQDIADSGYIKNGAQVLFLPGSRKITVKGNRDINPAGDFPVPLPYIRIAWIVLSALVIIGLILVGRKFSETNEE